MTSPPPSQAHPHGRASRPSRVPVPARLVEMLAARRGLDRPAERVAKGVRDVLGQGTLKDALSGASLGHALHPVLTDLPIGTWTSATLLDLLGDGASRDASQRLIGMGIAAALPTAATGLVDWADTTVIDEEVTRVGAVHALANVGALIAYSASLLARRRQHHRAGTLLGLVGMGAMTAGGYLGGHLAWNKAVAVDHTAFESAPQGWTDVVGIDELTAQGQRLVQAEGTPVLLVIEGDRIHAIADHCTHRGGPLHEGDVKDGCVTCPWHQSTFRLDSGSVVSGPASAPAPVYDTRVRDGRVEVKAPAQ